MITNQQITETLERARARIADPAHWCQRAAARNKTGEKCELGSRHAVAWCADGALARETLRQGTLRERCLDALEALTDQDIVRFNDAATHPQVLSVFSKAIKEQSECPE